MEAAPLLEEEPAEPELPELKTDGELLDDKVGAVFVGGDEWIAAAAITPLCSPPAVAWISGRDPLLVVSVVTSRGFSPN